MRLITLLAVVTAFALPRTGHTLHQASPGAIRVSQGDPVSLSPGRSWERYLAFSSTQDLVGGASGRQVYVFNLFAYDCQFGFLGSPDLASCPFVPVPFLTRITNGIGDADHPSVDDKGLYVAFDADGAYAGGVGTVVGYRQIFVQETLGPLRRITNGFDGDSTNPTLSQRGGVVAFESTATIFGPGGTPQIYVQDLRTNILRRITNGAGPSTRPMLNRLGTIVTFQSTAALGGDGHDTGVSQIFWYDLKKNLLFQMTNGNADSRNPWLASKVKSKTLKAQGVRGSAILFESAATVLNGAPAGPGTQIYAGTTKFGSTPPLAQITPVTIGGCLPGPGNAYRPTADASGRHIGFVADGDLLCNGTTGNRLFVADLSTLPSVLHQMTANGDVPGPIAGSLGLWFMAFTPTSDLTGQGVCGPQLHIVDFYAGHFGAASAAGQLPLLPPPGDADASCDDADACTADACVASTCVHTDVCP